MADQEEAWRFYVWCEALDWRHLPREGGLENQDEMLMSNIFAIKTAVNKVRGQQDG